jgi:hypothetical protein
MLIHTAPDKSGSGPGRQLAGKIARRTCQHSYHGWDGDLSLTNLTSTEFGRKRRSSLTVACSSRVCATSSKERGEIVYGIYIISLSCCFSRSSENGTGSRWRIALLLNDSRESGSQWKP